MLDRDFFGHVDPLTGHRSFRPELARRAIQRERAKTLRGWAKRDRWRKRPKRMRPTKTYSIAKATASTR